ncbi:MAG: dihydropteroate synthase [Pseudomonadota bacterium]
MGVLNVTPDSFSDGGRYRQLDAALNHAREMATEGAVIIDVGGESTRPGAQPVSEQEELDRVIPVIERLSRELDVLVSVDTMKPAVMRVAVNAGAGLINDVNALRAPSALEVARESGAAVCLMHMQGEPRTMQKSPAYEDVRQEVRDFLSRRLQACEQIGIPRERIVLDPGFGFGKSLQHNLALLGNLGALAGLGLPLMVGLSRKSMFQQLLGLPLEQRLHAGLAAAALAVFQGASIIRTHDVRPTVETIKTAAAVRAARSEE